MDPTNPTPPDQRNINGDQTDRLQPIAPTLWRIGRRDVLYLTNPTEYCMLRERRRSLPARSFRASWSKVTARVRRLVDDVHDGNLLEASVHAGVPYATLREIHAGRARHPTATLERLAEAYQLPVEWFFDGSEADDGTVPLAGWAGFLPDPCAGNPASGRRIAIPYAAWPLIRVLVQLEQRLGDLPAGPDRPIIGDATDPREIRHRVTAFVFQPLLAARSAGTVSPGWGIVASPDDPRWVEMLRDLGRFWEQALVPLVPGLLPSVPGRPLGEVA